MREDFPADDEQGEEGRPGSRLRRVVIIVIALLAVAGAWIRYPVLGLVLGFVVVIVLNTMFRRRPRPPVQR